MKRTFGGVVLVYRPGKQAAIVSQSFDAAVRGWERMLLLMAGGF